MIGIDGSLSSRVTKQSESAMMLMQKDADDAEKAGQKLTHLLRGEPDFDTPPHIVEAAKKALDGGATHYIVAWGSPKLRDAIAQKVKGTHGLDVSSGNVLITTGATQGLFTAIMAFLDEGDEALTLDPFYGPLEKMIDIAKGRLVTAPMAQVGGSLRVDAGAVKAKITPRTKILLLNSPMNPTGRVFTKEELDSLGKLVLEHKLVVISDETYDGLVYPGHTHISMASLSPELAARTVIVNSFSKTYAMTGWRLGYNVAPVAATKGMHAVFSQSGRMAAAFTQSAGLAAVTGTQEPVKEMLTEYTRRRELVLEGFKDMGQPVVAPEGTFYVFFDCARFGMPSLDLARHILKVGKVVTVPGMFFGKSTDSYIRVSFAASDEDLNNGLAGIKAAFDALPVKGEVRRP